MMIKVQVIESLRGLFDEPAEAGQFLDELIRIFDAAGAETLAEMHATLAKADTKALAKLAHKLKGISRNLGAEPLGDRCAALEDKATSSTLAEVAREVEAIAAEFSASSLELRETYYKGA